MGSQAAGMKGLRACIIGAGCSGFTTAKALQDKGIAFDCFEMSDQVGGNWVYKNRNGMSSCYQSLHIDTSKFRMAFEDYPIPDDFPDFPHHAQVLQYMNGYVDHFGLREKISFMTRVDWCERLDDGLWRVRITRLDGTGADLETETRLYDAVFVCNGHHWCARWPDPAFPGADRFEGVQMHSHDYLNPFEPYDMRGRNIIVVGMGNSAMDIASELGQKPFADRLYLSARRGVYVFPKYINGQPADKSPAPAWMPASWRRWFAARALEQAVGKMESYGLPKPDYKPLEAHPSVSGEILTRLGCGDVIPKPNIEEILPRSVRFTDGTQVDADVIIYATGYTVRFPFLDEDTVGLKDNHIKLFKRMIRPDIPSLFFMGLAQPLPTLVNFAEQQARFVTAYLTGHYHLPAPEDMEAVIEEDEQRFLGHFYDSPRHRMQVDFDDYVRDLKKEWAKGAKRARRNGYQPQIPARAADPALGRDVA